MIFRFSLMPNGTWKYCHIAPSATQICTGESGAMWLRAAFIQLTSQTTQDSILVTFHYRYTHLVTSPKTDIDAEIRSMATAPGYKIECKNKCSNSRNMSHHFQEVLQTHCLSNLENIDILVICKFLLQENLITSACYLWQVLIPFQAHVNCVTLQVSIKTQTGNEGKVGWIWIFTKKITLNSSIDNNFRPLATKVVTITPLPPACLFFFWIAAHTTQNITQLTTCLWLLKLSRTATANVNHNFKHAFSFIHLTTISRFERHVDFLGSIEINVTYP